MSWWLLYIKGISITSHFKWKGSKQRPKQRSGALPGVISPQSTRNREQRSLYSPQYEWWGRRAEVLCFFYLFRTWMAPTGRESFWTHIHSVRSSVKKIAILQRPSSQFSECRFSEFTHTQHSLSIAHTSCADAVGAILSSHSSTSEPRAPLPHRS